MRRAGARWRRRHSLAVVAGIVALWLAEGAARIAFEPPVVVSHLVADPLLGFRMPASVDTLSTDERGTFPYRLNSLGFPGPEPPRAASPAPAGGRVLLLGDSFLNPWRIRDEDWVGTVLRAELAARGRAGAEVFAMGSDDYGTAQELLLLRRHGVRVAPTAVVLLLYTGNDVINNSLALAGRSNVSPGDYFRPYLVDDGDGGLALRYALPWRARLRRSRLFALAEARWLALHGAQELREELSGASELTALQRVRRNELPDEQYELFRAPAPGSPWDRAWSDTDRLLLAFQREVEALGARPVVVVIPSLFQVELDATPLAHDVLLRRRGGPPLDEQLDWNWPEKHLEELFHRAGIAHVQMLAPLRRRLLEGRASVYRRDGHLNGNAHRLMGQRIAARLEDGAPEGCFVEEDGARPVDLACLFPGEALEVDLGARECIELFGWGWDGWSPSAESRGGWLLRSKGALLAPSRKGSLSVRGILLAQNRFPVRLSAALAYGASFAEQSFEGPGEFAFTFEMPEPSGAERTWRAWELEIEDRGVEEPPGLVLTGMSFGP